MNVPRESSHTPRLILGHYGVQYFTNTVSEIVLGECAHLDRYTLQQESATAYHISTTAVMGARGAHCSTHSLSLGGGLVRSDVVALLNGESGRFVDVRLYIAEGCALVEDHATIDHAMPCCSSARVVAAILGDCTRAVCDGTVAVHAAARATRARQTNRTLLLSDKARLRWTPQLDIVANATECSQRATVRRLEDAVAVYARARGVSDKAARRAVVLAFAGEALSGICREPFGDAICNLVLLRAERVLESAAG